jgi:hypothetical protein
MITEDLGDDGWRRSGHPPSGVDFSVLLHERPDELAREKGLRAVENVVNCGRSTPVSSTVVDGQRRQR